MTQQAPSIVEHADVLIPAFKYLASVIGWVLGIGLAALCTVVGYVGRMWAAKINEQGENIKAVKTKVEVLHDAMLMCDGCRGAINAQYGRRSTDERTV